MCPNDIEKDESTKTKQERVVTIIKERPDGSKETQIIEQRRSTAKVLKLRPVDKKWLIGLSASSGAILGGGGTYTLRVERYVLPGLAVGLYGGTNREVGLSLSYSF